MRAIDGDSHVIEPLDLFERYIDPAFRERAVRVEADTTGRITRLLVDNRPMRMADIDDLMSACAGYGQKEEGRALSDFDRYRIASEHWQDMDLRIRYLDEEGFAAQVLYPTMGLLWESSVEDPHLADALCRAYNTWAFELVAGHRDRLFPAAHISMRDAGLAVREMRRVAAMGCRAVFVGAAPIGGRSFGHPDFDPLWAAAQELSLAVGIHLVGHPNYTGSQWYRTGNPGFMYITMMNVQDPRMALTSMMYDGVFERFPRLKVATIESMAGWVGEWLERIDYRYKYIGYTSRMKRSASEYFARNIWVSANPEERMFPLMVGFAGDERFFIGSDYPHAEGFVHPIRTTRERLCGLPERSVEKILCDNPAAFYGI
ncbi:MAG TPA: amidohydrolase family protein [Candidatus Binataceae bacterium]|nr:amidohydrolase family protein [Candidatus Binataceae bacterium]